MGKYKVVSDHMEYLMNICEKHGPCLRPGDRRPRAANRGFWLDRSRIASIGRGTLPKPANR